MNVILIVLISFNGPDLISFEFLGEQFNFSFDKQVIRKNIRATDRSVSNAYEKLSDSDINSLIHELIDYKHEYQLDDWVYYKLVEKLINTALIGYSTNSKAFLMGYLLGSSGYKVDFYYTKNSVKLYVHSEDKVKNLSKIGNGYCLNCADETFSLIRSDLKNFQSGRNFSFVLDAVPKFGSSEVTTKEVSFYAIHLNNKYNIRYSVNKSWIDLLRTYPNLNLNDLFNTPLSIEASPLIDSLKAFTDKMSEEEAVYFLLSFTRFVSEYADDLEYFGKEKWMTPEETLYYPYGDCEDKSSLFYYLVKNVLQLPIIILKYPAYQHVNIAVALNKSNPNITYKGNDYFICEPTDATDLEKIGENRLYKKWKYEIIDE